MVVVCASAVRGGIRGFFNWAQTCDRPHGDVDGEEEGSLLSCGPARVDDGAGGVTLQGKK